MSRPAAPCPLGSSQQAARCSFQADSAHPWVHLLDSADCRFRGCIRLLMIASPIKTNRPVALPAIHRVRTEFSERDCTENARSRAFLAVPPRSLPQSLSENSVRALPARSPLGRTVLPVVQIRPLIGPSRLDLRNLDLLHSPPHCRLVVCGFISPEEALARPSSSNG